MKEYPKTDTLLKRDEDFKVNALSQANDEIYSILWDIPWVYTEKIDGTNMRLIWDGENFEIKGRTDKADIIQPLQNNMILMANNRKDLFKELFGNTPVCLYGEGYGPRIQHAGGLYSKEQSFVCFDILIGTKYLDWDKVKEICSALRIHIVPEYHFDSLALAIIAVEKGIKSHYGNFNAEGIIAKPPRTLYTNNDKRILFKLKTKDFRAKK